MKSLFESWNAAAELLSFAFQPIVNIHTGTVYGYESLLRGTEKAGFSSIDAVFDAAFDEGALYHFDCLLREKALTAFKTIPESGGSKLFYNLDNRITEMPDYSPGNTLRLLERFGMEAGSIVFEVSERHEFRDYDAARSVLEQYKKQDFRIAVDDFGAGYSGLQLLYFAQPDLIKIDRFFVDGIDQDQRKRLFVERIVDMAHLTGIHVVAEGVETEREFHACRKIGCDFVQGYLIERPKTDTLSLLPRYQAVSDMARNDRRGRLAGNGSLRTRVDPMETVRLDDDILAVLDRFKGVDEEPPHSIPVLDRNESCVGILRERDFRKYVYSPFGIALLRHDAAAAPLGGLVAPVPSVDINADLRTAQKLFLGSSGAEGIAVTEDGRYIGFLNARSILEAIAEEEISEARDQNPLSRLPGNAKLDAFLSERWMDDSADCLFCYFDFNDFKPFNDRYGFRRGDRVIQLFADILRQASSRYGWFIAHIGGDDFFAGIECGSEDGRQRAETAIAETIESFSRSVGAFYDEEDRIRGWIEERDRNSILRRFPLLSVCAAVYHRRPGLQQVPYEQAGELFASLKKGAKRPRQEPYFTLSTA